MSSAAAVEYGFKRFRVAKACVVCRLRKTKCNGEQPCDRCKTHSADCVYESSEPSSRKVSKNHSNHSNESPRHSERSASQTDGLHNTDRPSKKQKRSMIDTIADKRYGEEEPLVSETLPPSLKPGHVASHLELYESTDQDQGTEDEMDLDIHDGIRAHDHNTGNTQFYGFTSNFNFQHRLTQTIQALRLREQYPQSDSPSSSSRNGLAPNMPESMKTWGHQNIIFRQILSDSTASFPTINTANHAIGDSTFLPPSIVDRFVENYITIVQPQLAVVPKRQILKWVNDAKALGYICRGFSGVPWIASTGPSTNPTSIDSGKSAREAAAVRSMRTNELATLYVILALGALMDEGDWEDVYSPVPMSREGAIACGTTLFLLTKARLEEIVENSSITSARCLLLLGYFSMQWSSPNVSYLYLGYAARMCVSIGLHRETFYSQNNPKSIEHRRLWWACYYIERRISTWFGQASAIRDEDVSTRLSSTDNSYDAFLVLNARIARVCSDMSRLSSNPPTVATEVISAAEAMEQELIKIRDQAPSELQAGLHEKFGQDAGDDSDSSDLVVRRYCVNTFWWYLRLLIYSPLIIFALYRRSIGQEIPAEVLKYAHISARAGQQLVDIICNARSDMPRPGLDNMRFGSFYLDSACTIVLSTILCDPSHQKLAFEYLASIDRAIKHLEKKNKIYADHGTKASLLKARDLVVLAQQVVRAAAGQSASSRSHNDASCSVARSCPENVPSEEIPSSQPWATTSTHFHARQDDEGWKTDKVRQQVNPSSLPATDSLNSETFRSAGPSVASLLSPSIPERSNTEDRMSQPAQTVANQVVSPQLSAHRSFTAERDDWMNYFLSSFDWLQTASASTPTANASSSSLFTNVADISGNVAPSPTNGMVSSSSSVYGNETMTTLTSSVTTTTTTKTASHPVSSILASGLSSSSSSSPSPYRSADNSHTTMAGDLDMALIMGGVSVLEGPQQ